MYLPHDMQGLALPSCRPQQATFWHKSPLQVHLAGWNHPLILLTRPRPYVFSWSTISCGVMARLQVIVPTLLIALRSVSVNGGL